LQGRGDRFESDILHQNFYYEGMIMAHWYIDPNGTNIDLSKLSSSKIYTHPSKPYKYVWRRNWSFPFLHRIKCLLPEETYYIINITVDGRHHHYSDWGMDSFVRLLNVITKNSSV
jgi:hypothetical protein